MIYLRRVVGDSMLPTLKAEQLVLAVRSWRPKPGAIVIIRHDGLEKIKRIEQVADGQVFVLGDNLEASTDSRKFGWLPRGVVVARVLWPRADSVAAKIQAKER